MDHFSLPEHFSQQFDGLPDLMDTAELVVLVRMATTMEDFFTLLPARERTRGEDIYNESKNMFMKISTPFIN